jgi:hypothetical protein
MTATVNESFPANTSPEILAALRDIADAEGKPLQCVVDEALRQSVECKGHGRARPPVLAAFEDSLEEFDTLYRELAK